jgi:hypothetical protein
MAITPKAVPAVGRRERSAGGERLGGFIYGTIVALAGVVAGARAYPHSAGHVAALVAVTSCVLWLAHVYAHALSRSVSHGDHFRVAELREVAYHELSIVEAAVPPLAALLLGVIGLVSDKTCYWLALGVGLVVLGNQGVRFARIERLGTLATVGIVAANVCFGVLLIALKLIVIH